MKTDFIVRVTRAPGTPRKPAAKDFQAVFERAWQLIPAARNPQAFTQKRVTLTIQLIDDAAIAALNAEHMNHKGPTDVLSFPINDFDPEARAFNLGDVILSFETAQREAAARNISVEEETLRYAVHGFLHCMGYEDSTAAKRKAMFEIQERALK